MYEPINIVAYNCDNAYEKYLVYDSLNVKKCSLEENWISEEEDVEIQVIQEKYQDTVQVYKCTISRTVEIGNILVNFNIIRHTNY